MLIGPADDCPIVITTYLKISSSHTIQAFAAVFIHIPDSSV